MSETHLVLDRGDNPPGGTTGADDVLVGNGEKVPLVNRQLWVLAGGNFLHPKNHVCREKKKKKRKIENVKNHSSICARPLVSNTHKNKNKIKKKLAGRAHTKKNTGMLLTKSSQEFKDLARDPTSFFLFLFFLVPTDFRLLKLGLSKLSVSFSDLSHSVFFFF